VATRIGIVQRILAPYRFPLFQALARRQGIDLTLVYGQPSPFSALKSVEPPEEAGCFRLHNRYWGKKERLVWSSGLLKFLWKQRFEVTIAEFNPRIVSNVVACLLTYFSRNRFVWWGHGLSPESLDSNWITSIRLKLIQLSDGIVLYEESMAKHLTDLGVPPERIYVARNTIDTAAIERLRNDDFPGNRDRILYVGRLVPGKKLDLLIQAFGIARSDVRNDLRLTIVGDGPERDNLSQEVDRLNLSDRVELLPGTYDEEMLSGYFNGSMISVTPGYVGLSVIHCLAYGLPVITAIGEPHSPEFAALEHGRNSEIVSKDSPGELAKSMTNILNDPDRLLSLHRGALETSRDWSGIESMVGSFELAITHLGADSVR
jgi:glycosyltransferase involved in cell wall biosynthesis